MVTKWLPPLTEASWSPVGENRKELLISTNPEQALPCILLVHWLRPNSELTSGKGGWNYHDWFRPVALSSLGPAAVASPGNLLEIQIFQPHLIYTQSRTPGEAQWAGFFTSSGFFTHSNWRSTPLGEGLLKSLSRSRCEGDFGGR